MKLRKNFTKGAGMLAILGVIGKVVGVFYRLPLTNVLGAEGMGLYQMIFPLYSLILAISCGGIPTAISKYISELNASGSGGEKRALKISIVVLAALSFFLAAVVFAFRKNIAFLQGNGKASLAYAAIAPAIIFSAIISCFRGYFQGLQNMLPSGISQVVEQVAKVAFGLTFAFLFMDKGVEYGVMGAIIGISVSEFIALIYMVLKFRINSKNSEAELAIEAAADVLQRPQIKTASVLKAIYSVALPVTIGSLVMPLSQVLDSFLVVNLLVNKGSDVETATSLYGIFNGPVGSLINMPTVITVALASALLPKIVYKKSKGQDCAIEVDGCINAFFTVMLPVSAVFAIAPKPIISILYSGGLSTAEIEIASRVLRIESINVLLVGLIQLTSAIMQGVGRVKTPVINLLIGAVIKIAATVTLVPVIGIYGAAVSNVAFYMVTGLLDVICARRYYGRFISLKKQAVTVLCACCFVAIFSLYLLFIRLFSDIVALIIAAFLSAVAYLLLIIKTKCILFREMLF